MKIVDRKNSKLSRRQLFMIIAGLVTGIAFSSPVVSYAQESQEEVLYEDDEDDYTTEKIDNNDVVEDNTVVQDGDKPAEEEKQEEQKPAEEEKQEEQKHDGGSCVTPENGYDEEAGKDWDPSIKTETEKKGLTENPPDNPPDNPPSNPPETPTEDTPSTVTTVVETPVETPAPAKTPKTGDLTLKEILGVLAGLGLIAGGVSFTIANNVSDKEDKKRTR